jgi:predicted secreted protein
MAAVSYAGNGLEPPDHITKILLDESWNGKRIELKVGDEIQIELQGIGATGYSWYFDKLDRDFFQLISEERRREKKEGEEIIGSPIQYIWIIKAKKIGNSTIEMNYYRVWEGKDKTIRQFKVDVNIIP